ncbi:3-keto-disaccharide hydrolase [Bryobacter aggregatus]|uniref:3-keto-disaccharide hydrolase n=1 Tax=Bryobacter aggregatus TaxID=360054 RepID=UPI0004E0B991|nr:DUF1080 domain-containing protein [Bryobacter aggregatus]
MRKFVWITLLAVTSLPGASWKQLFNGKDTSGWQMTGPGEFTVEDGMLKTNGGMGLLYYTGKPFANTTLKVVFKTTGERSNSGVFIRLPEKPRDPWYGVHNGYEVQIDSGGDEWHRTGAIYSLSKAGGDWKQNPAGEWNTMEIQLQGKKTVVFLNGKKVNEFVEGQAVPERKAWYEPVRGPRPDVGYIGLQNHDAKSQVYFKEVSVKE